jgi:CubicO group peptidase (beta-lactamase class C family)
MIGYVTIGLAALLIASSMTACQPKQSAVASGRHAEAETQPDDPSHQRADATIAQVMSRMHVPGMALVVVRDGKLIKQGAYGIASEELGAPVTEGTRFQIASATKVLTGTLVMQLVQDGVLDLEAPLRRYLPDAPPAWESITIAQLAAHASGIPDFGVLDRPQSSTAREVSAWLAQQPLAFAPGTKAQYGLSDFVVLTVVIEKLTGKSFEELLQSRLGLQCTGFDHALEDGPTRRADVIPGRVGVYRWEGDRQRTAEFSYTSLGYPSGGAFACAGDLARWAIAMDQGKLLSPASEQRAATQYRLADGRLCEFGVVFVAGTLLGHRVYGHPGGPALADIVRLPDDKLTVAVFANQKTLYPNIASVIAQLYLPKAALPAPIREAPELRAKLEQVDPAQIAALPPLDRIELVAPNRYRATYGDIVMGWKVETNGELTQIMW